MPIFKQATCCGENATKPRLMRIYEVPHTNANRRRINHEKKVDWPSLDDWVLFTRRIYFSIIKLFQLEQSRVAPKQKPLKLQKGANRTRTLSEEK